MAILLHFGVAACHQNYDVTSRVSNDVGFFKNVNTCVFSPTCTILPSYSKIEAGRFFFWYTLLYIGYTWKNDLLRLASISFGSAFKKKLVN